MYDMHRTKGLTIFCLTSWLFWSIGSSDDPMACIRDISPSIDQPLEETSPEGYLLLNLSVAEMETWSLAVKSPSLLLQPYFNLTQNGTSLTLTLAKVYDLENVYTIVKTTAIFFVEFGLECTAPSIPKVVYSVYATIQPVNEFAPTFVKLPENGFNVSESADVNSTLLMLKEYVVDADVQTNPAVLQFTLLPTVDAQLDGRQKMVLTDSVSGGVFLSQALDYEAMDPQRNYFILNLTVGDREGLTSSGTVRINVIDADDLPPEFVYPGCARNSCSPQYIAAIADSFQGNVTWLSPAPIAAQDQDTVGSPVWYRLKLGEPENYGEYIAINSVTGTVSVLKTVAGTNITSFRIIVEAVERTLLQHSAQTLLWLVVVGRNDSVPTLPPDPVVVEVEVATPAAAFFRLATIVLGVLLGVVLVLLVVVVLCSVRTSKPSYAPDLPCVFKPFSDYSVSSEEPRGTESNGSAIVHAAPERRSSREIERSPSRNSSEHHFFASRWPYSGITGSSGSGDPGARTASSPVPSEPREDYSDGAGLRQAAEPAVLEIPRGRRVQLQEPEVEEQEVSFEVEDLELDLDLDHEPEDEEEAIYARPAPRVRPDVPEASPHLATISSPELQAPSDRTRLVGPRQAVEEEHSGLSNPVYNDVGNGDHVTAVANLDDRLIVV